MPIDKVGFYVIIPLSGLGADGFVGAAEGGPPSFRFYPLVESVKWEDALRGYRERGARPSRSRAGAFLFFWGSDEKTG